MEIKILLSNSWMKKKLSKGINIVNKMESDQNLWDAAKSGLQGKLRALNNYIRKNVAQ